MMQSPDPVPPITGLCWFMLRRLPLLLDAFEKEIEGVRTAEDSEYIHRMRVASRRLRAALPLFCSCFPKKAYNRWMNEITTITRALGEARDTDVQIAFLVKYQKRSLAAWKKRPGRGTTEPPSSLAVRYLLADLRKRRGRLQDHVLVALDALEKSRVLPAMREELSRLTAGSRRIPRQGLAYGIPALAAYRIEARLATMLSFEPWVSHKEAVAEHHALRIATKKLRYTMETFGPVYRLGLKKPHARVKKIQEILGDLHDCDVWIDHVTLLLLKERSRFRPLDGEKGPDTATIASLRIFLQEREKERVVIHRRFMRYWESLCRAGLWDEIRHTLIFGRKKLFIPAGCGTASEIRAAATALAADVPPVLPHVHQVTRLALMFFDATLPFHRLTSRDRLLLETAGMLHDLGWKGRRRNHHGRSARAIISSQRLPLDCEERAVVTLAAFAHNGRDAPRDHPFFVLLSPEFRKKTLQVTAILRVANALDAGHRGTVHEVHCIIENHAITCDVVSVADAVAEKEQARIMAGLFAGAFGRELVIR